MTSPSIPLALPGPHISLMHGWLPITVQAIGVAVLLAAIGWRSPRWRLLGLPGAALIGTAGALAARWYISANGLAGEPVPAQLWVWIVLSGLAVGVALLGWRSARRWRRAISVLAIALCLLGSALAVNVWVGYFPTVQSAWSQLTAGPLPDQASTAAVTATAAAAQTRHVLPAKGSVVPVNIPATASNFRHRGELVYLPPVWFASTPPPRLPTVMMIGGEFNTPADWLRTGNAITVIDKYAAAHSGNAPVFVFVDPGGAFNNDTECVNGPRGNAADHLTKDVVPFMAANFGVSPDRAHWGIVGWSMGGTCAVDLTAMHPDTFSSFVDIAGDLSPNSGNRTQTVDRLFGGNQAAWAAFDPTTVITKHPPYQGVSGWFAINGDTSTHTVTGSAPSDQAMAANSLCSLGSANGIDCAVITRPGKHDWPFAARVFAEALPWLAGALHTPDAPAVPLPTIGPTVSAAGVTNVRNGSAMAAAGR